MSNWSKVNGFWASNDKGPDTAVVYDNTLCVSCEVSYHRRKTTAVPLNVIIDLLEQQGYKVTK